MRWFFARGCVAIACVLGSVGAATLAAEETRYDSSVVAVRGAMAPRRSSSSGMVGGVSGFRRLASLLESQNRVVSLTRTVSRTIQRMSRSPVSPTTWTRSSGSWRRLGLKSSGTRTVRGSRSGLAATRPVASRSCTYSTVAPWTNRTALFASSLKWASFITKLPGGRNYVRGRLIKGIKQNAGRHDWLDSATVRAYTEPVLGQLSKAISLAKRLDRAREPEPNVAVVERVRVPVTVLLGDVPHPAEPDSSEITALAPLGDLVRVERLPGVGHFPHEEAPGDVAAYLQAGTVAEGWRNDVPRSFVPQLVRATSYAPNGRPIPAP